jgi:hypothetical protein
VPFFLHGEGERELWRVEGGSAGQAVGGVRARSQAVFLAEGADEERSGEAWRRESQRDWQLEAQPNILTEPVQRSHASGNGCPLPGNQT